MHIATELTDRRDVARKFPSMPFHIKGKAGIEDTPAAAEESEIGG
jgi:hypothetical protein